MERVLDKRIIKFGGKEATEYLVKFKGYINVWNEWYPEGLLDNARELVHEYEEKLMALPRTRTRSSRRIARRL